MTVALLAFTACRRVAPDEVEVTFTVDMPQQLLTRAIGDGTSAVDLHFRVYRVTNGNVECVTSLGQDISNAFEELHTTISTHLVRYETYHFVFWAQSAAATPAFDLSSLDSGRPYVTVDYTAISNSDETIDAFFVADLNYVATDDQTLTEVLRRPFAQVNFASSGDDWTDAVTAGAEVTATSMTIKDVYTRLYVLDGSVSNPVDVTFKAAALPDERLIVKDVAYKWLSMDYVLVAAEKDATNVSLELFHDNVQLPTISVSNVPIQRNWRTNILGRLLTTRTGFIIEIDPVYTDEYDVGIAL